MPIPAYSITVTPKGGVDFYATLTQPPNPTETFDSNRSGMMQTIPALGERARHDLLDTISTPLVIARSQTPIPLTANVWNPIIFDMVDQNFGNWYNPATGQFLAQPPVSYYYHFSIRATLSNFNFNDSAFIRIVTNGVAQRSINMFVNKLAISNLEITISKTFLVLAGEITTFEINPTIATTMLPFNYTDWPPENENFLEISQPD